MENFISWIIEFGRWVMVGNILRVNIDFSIFLLYGEAIANMKEICRQKKFLGDVRIDQFWG
jgi:hypothetical protein